MSDIIITQRFACFRLISQEQWASVAKPHFDVSFMNSFLTKLFSIRFGTIPFQFVDFQFYSETQCRRQGEVQAKGENATGESFKCSSQVYKSRHSACSRWARATWIGWKAEIYGKKGARCGRKLIPEKWYANSNAIFRSFLSLSHSTSFLFDFIAIGFWST